MYLGPYSNSDRRLGHNIRSPSPLAMEPSYNGLSNLHGSYLHHDSASSDGVSPFSSNSNSLGRNGSTSDSGLSIIHGTQDLHLGFSRRPSPHGFIQPRSFEDEVLNLRHINANLEMKNQMLQAQHDTLREAYSALLKAIPGSNSVTQDSRASQQFPDIAPLDRKDYPNVRFWFKRHWTESLNDQVIDVTLPLGTQGRGRTRASLNVNVAMRYVELEDGKVIDGDRGTEIRKFARAIWVSFGKRGLAPAKWGQADVETRKQYCREMNSRFPELRFCDLDWKSEQIATDNYPSWYTNWASRPKQMKHENEEDIIIDKSAQSKRPRKPSTQSASKRKKVENQTDGDDSMVRLDDATMESDVVIVTANIPATTGNTQMNVSPVPAVSSDTELLANNFDPSRIVPRINISPVPAVSSDTELLANNFNPSRTVPQINVSPVPAVSSNTELLANSLDPSRIVPQINVSPVPAVSSDTVSKDFQITASVCIADAFSEKINDLSASSAHVPGSSIHENRVALPASAIQSTTPDANNINTVPPMATGNDDESSSFTGSASVANYNVVVSAVSGFDRSQLSVLGANPGPMANSSALPSESMVPPGNHETTATEKNAPRPGAAKKSSKMRPGTTNTARSLCSQEWCKENPRGTTAEFKNYFDNLSPEALKWYEDLSASKQPMVEKKRKAGTATTGPDTMHV